MNKEPNEDWRMIPDLLLCENTGLTPNARLTILREAFRQTKEDFALKIGISRSHLSNIENGKRDLTLELVAFLNETYGVSTDWLICGKGNALPPSRKLQIAKALDTLISNGFTISGNGFEMPSDAAQVNAQVNAQATPANKSKGTKKINTTEEQPPYHTSPSRQLVTRPLMVTVDNCGQENIAFVNTEAAAGYPERFLEPEYYSTLPTFSLPDNMFRNATFRCFQVAGNSMSPSFEQNDWVIASYVDNWPSNLKTNFVYVIVTTTNVLVKRVMNRLEQRNRLVLLSDNEDHDPIEIDQEEVRELWYVRARLSFRFPNIRFNTQQKVRDLEVDFFNLREEFQQLRQQALPNR